MVGLVARAERIAQVRPHCVLEPSSTRLDTYVDRQAVADEIAYSRKLCARHGWPLIDVTRRSIEETSAAVMKLLSERRRAPDVLIP